MSDLEPRELERRTVHEAGHAVMATLFGCRMERIVLEPEGRCENRAPACKGESDPEGARNDVVISYAGAAAEGLFFGGTPSVVGQDDSNTLWPLEVLEADFRKRRPSATRPYRFRRCLRWTLWRKTKRLVLQHEKSIRALASELVLKGTMTGEEVDSFLRRLREED